MTYRFRLKFNIEGVSELSHILLLKQKQLSDFKKPLFKSAKMITEDVEIQFRTEGSLSGGWKSLAESTVKGRIREGYGGEHPILQRTGALRRSFYSRVDSKRAFISSNSPYYGFHQSRMDRNKLSRRPMLLLTERTRENIIETFNDFLRFK
jgi:phage gpG-like protein